MHWRKLSTLQWALLASGAAHALAAGAGPPDAGEAGGGGAVGLRERQDRVHLVPEDKVGAMRREEGGGQVGGRRRPRPAMRLIGVVEAGRGRKRGALLVGVHEVRAQLGDRGRAEALARRARGRLLLSGYVGYSWTVGAVER